MKKFEYACLHLIWSGNNKGVSITQFGETRILTLNSNKKFMENNHFSLFNTVMGVLGANGWELVSISTLMGTNISIMTDIHTTQSESQEFWFKRDISDEQAQSIEETLSSAFDGATLKTSDEIKQAEKKKENEQLWLNT